ncbi:hypothetical protein [Nostoc sp. NZL]|uniref:hypothetical protein n=1 Tax=Nostoc sp. NZL TaxID=2650612 RepID=UPI0018C7B021|nr:hypothetical protein [Nostoc sp. NZL]
MFWFPLIRLHIVSGDIQKLAIAILDLLFPLIPAKSEQVGKPAGSPTYASFNF